MSHEILLKQLELGAKEEPFVVVGVVKTEGPTAVRAGNKAIILADGTIKGWVGGHCTEHEITQNAMDSLKDGSTRFLKLSTCHGGLMDVYIEPYLPKRKLIIVGHIPIVSALSKIAKILGFTVIVLDREASKKKFPQTDVVLKGIDDLDRIHVTDQTYVVIATMGEFDQEYAERLVRTETPYVGIVAGKNRADDVFNYLRANNVPEGLISKIKSPAGIYLRAVTSEEIALSIMAEIVELARYRVKGPATEGKTPVAHATPVTRENNQAELRNQSSAISVDPVCGMTVDKLSIHISEVNGETKFFCSETCKKEFDKNPSSYVIKSHPN